MGGTILGECQICGVSIDIDPLTKPTLKNRTCGDHQDNTIPVFYSHWSKEQLQNECARLNQVLEDCLESLQKADFQLSTTLQATHMDWKQETEEK